MTDVDMMEDVADIPDLQDEEMKHMEKEEKKSKSDEVEEDAEDDKRPRVEVVQMNGYDATLNCLLSENNIMLPLQGDGLNLLAACRANIGLRRGRYYFEAEILHSAANPEVRIGFSTSRATLYLGDKGSLCYSSTGAFITDSQSTFKGRRFAKGDLIGVLLNRTADIGNKNTISLFINGNRIPSAVHTLPDEMADEALYPHIVFKNATVTVNCTKHVWKALPFTVRTIGDASAEDCESTTFTEVPDAQIVVPFAANSKDWVTNYVAEHAAENFLEISVSSINTWQEKSGVSKALLSDDAIRCLQKVMALRKRNYVWTLNNMLLAKNRVELCSRFPKGMKKTCIVVTESIEKLTLTMNYNKDVALPTTEEGFTAIEHTESAKESETALTKWQKNCKLHTKVEDLKVGTWFTEQVELWHKLRNATKSACEKKKRDDLKKEQEEKKEEKEDKKDENKETTEKKTDAEKKEDEEVVSHVDVSQFADEDWMLADLRAEMHLLVHAFITDVEDKERISFGCDHMLYYYKQYAGKPFFLSAYGVQKVADCLEIIPETISIQDGLLIPQLEKDDAFDAIIQHTEDARQERCDRIGAGDEGANLKFTAKKPLAAQKGPRGGGGGKGNKGQQMPIKSVAHMYSSNQSPKGFSSKGTSHKGSQKGGTKPSYQMRVIPSAGSLKRPGSQGNAPPTKRFQR